MEFIFKLAIINLLRKKRRSFFVITSIVVGITGGLLGVSMGNGYVNQLVSAVIRFETADVIIHDNLFFNQMEPSALLKDSEHLIQSMNAIKGINAVTARIKINGFIRSALTTSNIDIIGVNPSRDQLVFPIHEAIQPGKGNYFTKYDRIPIVIGNTLADQLGASINSRLVLSGQSKNGDLFSSAFWVCGIYTVDNKLFEKKSVFVLLDDLAIISGFQKEEVHEIALKLDEKTQSPGHIISALRSQLPDLKISSWSDIRPEIYVTMSYINLMLNILMSIILFAISVGIINIMIIVVYERRKEFGMLRALGMNKLKIFSMITFEIFFLLIVALFISTLINFTVLTFLSQNGVPVWSVEGANSLGVGTVDRIYPVLRWQQLLFVSGLVVLLSFMSSIIPTLKILDFHPTEAMKN